MSDSRFSIAWRDANEHGNVSVGVSAAGVTVVAGGTVRGSYLGSCVTHRDVPRFIDLYREGRFRVDQLVSHRLELDDINLALDRLADGAALRQVIEF